MSRFFLLLFVAGVLGAGGWFGWHWYRSTRPDYRLQAGLEALDHDDQATAERMANLLEAGGFKDHAHLLRGKQHVLQGRFDKALEELNLIRDEGDLRVEAAALCGRCHLAQQFLEEAERDFLFVLNERPDHIEGYSGLAAVYYDMGISGLALTYCEKWAQRAPEDGRPYRFQGFIQKDLKRPDEAIASYRKALERHLAQPAVQEVLLELAETLVQKNQFRPALDALQKCDGEAAETPQAQTLRAQCLVGTGQAAAGLALLKEVCSASPDFAPARQALGREYLQAGKFAEAAAQFERAVAINRHDFASRTFLAQAYSALQRRTEAKQQLALAKATTDALDELSKLTQKLAENAKDPAVHRRIAELYDKLDSPQQATRHRRAARGYQVPGKAVP